MSWDRYLAALHTGGPELAALVDSAQGGAGSEALTATRLLYDPDEMARLSSQIQDRCEGGGTTLFAGMRAAEYLDGEQRERFRRLAAGGVTVVLYGVGSPERLPPGVLWVEVPARSTALENQWFVVTEAPEPMALMSFVISSHAPAGRSRPGDNGQTFAAFVSRDQRLVEAVVRILRMVATGSGVQV